MEIEIIESLVASNKIQPLFDLGDSFGEHLGRKKCNLVTCAEFLLGYAGLGNTIDQYKEMVESFLEYVDTPSGAPADLQPAYEHLQSVGYRPFRYQDATFAPSPSWAHQDVLDYFLLFVDPHDFDVEPFKTRVGGKEFIKGEVIPMVSSDTWKKFLSILNGKFWENGAKFINIIRKNSDLVSEVTKYVVHFGDAKNNENMDVEFRLPDDALMNAFGGEYCASGFSERDFTAVVRGLVEKKFYPPPGTTMKANRKREYFSSYSCLLQSSCSGKTRFLLEPIKQDERARCLVIYFSCQPNSAIGVSDDSYNFLLQHVINTKNILEIPRRLAAMYCFIVRSISDANKQLKKEYRQLGSLKFGESFDLQGCIDCINSYDMSKIRLDRPKIASLRCSSKPVYVVLALDEAHHMLKEDIKDSKDFFKYHPHALTI